MKLMGQLTILAAIGLAGTILADLLPIPFPGSIMSLMLLFLLLVVKLVKVRHIEQVSHFFLSHMGAFFIVPMVAIIEQGGVLGQSVLVKFLALCVISTIITFLATAGAVKLTLVAMASTRKRKESSR